MLRRQCLFDAASVASNKFHLAGVMEAVTVYTIIDLWFDSRQDPLQVSHQLLMTMHPIPKPPGIHQSDS